MAQSCIINNGRARGCRDQVAGVKKAYFINYMPSLANDVTQDVDGTITDFPVLNAYLYDLTPTTTGYIETINSSLENGTRFYNGALSLVLLGNSQEHNNELDVLVTGTPQVVLEMNDGTFIMVAIQNGLFSSGELSWGTAFGDRTGAALNMQSNEPLPAIYVADFLNIANVTIVAETLT